MSAEPRIEGEFREQSDRLVLRLDIYSHRHGHAVRWADTRSCPALKRQLDKIPTLLKTKSSRSGISDAGDYRVEIENAVPINGRSGSISLAGDAANPVARWTADLIQASLPCLAYSAPTGF
ncbi:hypothetical protein [Caulobacter sp. CCUG 60055]|uniref:hypothetical protein n=1 Tax=Caulobacter sp. CCUG 60055 TaxID=2100090 RepID=UPI001FA774D2|nr:hypothetical protein [Caulobacter sp. CCUG 60055]